MRDEIVSIVERELGEMPVRTAQVEEGLLHETYELSCNEEGYILQLSEVDEKQEDSLRRGLNWHLILQNAGIPVPRVVTEKVKEFNERKYILVEKLPVRQESVIYHQRKP